MNSLSLSLSLPPSSSPNLSVELLLFCTDLYISFYTVTLMMYVVQTICVYVYMCICVYVCIF